MKLPTIHEWINQNNFVNEKGELLNFNKDHKFLLAPYSDFSQRQAYKKGSQMGGSIMMNIKCFHAMKNCKWNIIYTLPSDRDVWEFVPTKTDKLISVNPILQETLEENKVELKGMFNRFLHFKGTRSKTAAIMTTADLLIHDEIDRSDQGVIETYKSRIKRSEYKGIWELSNPSIKNTGIDITWKRSDQKEWTITCWHCKHEQILNWHKNVDYVNKQYICVNCKSVIEKQTRRNGHWVVTNPGSDVSGWHMSQLMAPWLSCAELIREEEETDEEYFYNFILGEPVGEGEAEDFRKLIVDAWTPKNLDTPPYFMGIDVGSTKHYVIGNKDGIFKIGKCKDRIELEMLIEHYNPTVVMDAGPERTWADEFRRKYPKMWLCVYGRDKKTMEKLKWGEKEKAGMVYADRYRIIDAVVTAIVYADIMFDLDSADLEAYIKHWLVMVKKREIDALGSARFVWEKNTEHAQDHFQSATVYYWIARQRGSAVDYVPSKDIYEKPKILVAPDQMMDLEEYFDELNS